GSLPHAALLIGNSDYTSHGCLGEPRVFAGYVRRLCERNERFALLFLMPWTRFPQSVPRGTLANLQDVPGGTQLHLDSVRRSVRNTSLFRSPFPSLLLNQAGAARLVAVAILD